MADPGTTSGSVARQAPVAAKSTTEDKVAIDSSDSETRSAESDAEIDGDYGSYRDHIFTDPEVAKYWTDVMHKASYEGRHRFDPDFMWSATEEKRVKRKVGSLCHQTCNVANFFRLTNASCERSGGLLHEFENAKLT